MMRRLRAYQRDLVEKACDALIRALGKVMLQLPTGGGKTVVGGELISKWLMQHPDAGVVWMTHRIELCSQTAMRLQVDFGLTVTLPPTAWNPGTPAPIVAGGVQILQAQTVSRRVDRDGRMWRAYGIDDLLVVDEAHHAPALGWEMAIATFPGRVIGLTATPWRLSASQGFDHIFDDLICGPQIPELQRAGHLAPSRTFTPPLEDRVIGGIVGATGDFTEAGIEESNSPLVMTTKAVQYWTRMSRRRQTIVYAVSKRHAHNLVQEFAKRNVAAAVILSETPAYEREAAIEGFRAGEIRVLVNVMIATEGFDLPDASCIVITRPTRSLTLFLQMVGRGLRPKPNNGDCLILDLTGNSETHGVPETMREWSLAPRGEPEDGEAPVVRCLSCGFMAHPSYHQCPECDADMGKICARCGRFRLWTRWSGKIVCDHCVPDLTVGEEGHLEQISQPATLAGVTEPSDEPALLALYHATGGPTWARRDGWATDLPLSRWFGVSVNDAGRVTRLDLPGNGLSGQIPEGIGSLIHVISIDLSGNALVGQIPSTLGRLTSLLWLDLSNNQLDGKVPPNLGNVPGLTWLRLHDNLLEMPVPPEVRNLKNLEMLRISDDLLIDGP